MATVMPLPPVGRLYALWRSVGVNPFCWVVVARGVTLSGVVTTWA